MKNCITALEEEHLYALREETEEAYRALKNSLTESDLERLHAIRHEVKSHINWGRVVSFCFSELLVSMEKVIFEGGKKLTSQGHPAFEQLFPSEQEFVQENDLRRHYLVLQLVKKLLGALKTKTNQAVKDIPFLDFDKEEDLKELILGNEQELASVDDSPYDSETRRKFFDFKGDELDEVQYTEEEMDLVAEFENNGENGKRAGGNFQRPLLEDADNFSDLGKIIIHSDLHRPESDTNCHHNATTTTIINEGGTTQYFREYCKMCRQVIRKEKIEKVERQLVVDPEQCEHKSVLWVKNKEGKEAYCTACNLAPVPNPEKYNWVYAGLEPYGDDPSLDQIINLEEAMSCES